LRPRDLRVIAGMRARPNACSLPSTIRFSHEMFASNTGWRRPLEETRTFEAHPQLNRWVFTCKFRYCPSCLRGGFHSYWFQFEGIENCPIHHLPLQDLCMQCGSSTGNVGSMAVRTCGPYMCAHCGHPIAGCDFSPDAHMALRKAGDFDDAFGPLQRWWSSESPELERVTQLVVQNTIDCWSAWCDSRKMILEALRQLCPWPGSDSGQRVTLTMLSWQQDLPPQKDGVYARDHRRPPAQSSHQSVYSSTVLRLHRWAFDGPNGGLAASDMRALVEKGLIDVSGRDPRQITLAWFRLVHEHVPPTPFGWVNPRKSRWKGGFPCRYVGPYLQKLPLRAFLLGVFAVLYTIVVDKLSREDAFDLRGLQSNVATLVPLVYLPSCGLDVVNGQSSDGFVLFPTVPGLDLASFWPGLRRNVSD
jgi:hypothetical protein